MKQVAIDLGAGAPDGGDGQADTVNINSTNGQPITVADHNGVVTVSGLASTVTISNFEANLDQLFINGQSVTVADGQTVTVAAVNSNNTGGTSTATMARTLQVSPCWASTWHRASSRRAMATVERRLLIRRRASSRC